MTQVISDRLSMVSHTEETFNDRSKHPAGHHRAPNGAQNNMFISFYPYFLPVFLLGLCLWIRVLCVIKVKIDFPSLHLPQTILLLAASLQEINPYALCIWLLAGSYFHVWKLDQLRVHILI